MPSQTGLRKTGKKVLHIGLWLLFNLLLPQLAAVAGTLDGFIISAAGTANITTSSAGAGVRVVAVQPWDGKILIGGDFTITGGSPVVSRTNLARLNNDGTLDTAFAPEPNAPVNAIVIEQDKTDPTQPGQSRIYIGGEFATIAAQPRNGLARFDSAGSLDGLFAPATAAGTVIHAMVLQSQRIVVGGLFSEMDHLSALEGAPCRNLAALSLAGGGSSGPFRAASTARCARCFCRRVIWWREEASPSPGSIWQGFFPAARSTAAFPRNREGRSELWRCRRMR